MLLLPEGVSCHLRPFIWQRWNETKIRSALRHQWLSGELDKYQFYFNIYLMNKKLGFFYQYLQIIMPLNFFLRWRSLAMWLAVSTLWMNAFSTCGKSTAWFRKIAKIGPESSSTNWLERPNVWKNEELNNWENDFNNFIHKSEKMLCQH
jgi:hypothetical protein